jgi:hypothetical protein
MILRALLMVIASATAALVLARRSQHGASDRMSRLARGERAGRIERCPIHGISFDRDNEVCPVCAQQTISTRPGS